MSESRLSPTAYVLIGIAIGGLAGACAAGADQPNMQAALGSLRGGHGLRRQLTRDTDRQASGFIDAELK